MLDRLLQQAARCSLLAALVLAILGCSKSNSEGFRVALVTPGAITDDGWNSYAYEGLKRIESELGATVRHFQTKAPAEFESTLRNFAADGFTLVIAHGHEYSDAAKKVGAEFPGTTFVVTSGEAVASNISSIDFKIEEAAYLAGMLAGFLTRTGKIGCVGGQEIPPVRDAFAAFERGAKAARPEASIVISWIGSWEDVAAANQAARAQIAQGVDLLFHDADAAGLGVFNAAEEHELLAIGCNKNQNAVKPTVVVGSVVLEIPAAFLALAKEAKEGRHVGARRVLDLRAGFVSFVLNPALMHRVSTVMTRAIELEEAKFRQG